MSVSVLITCFNEGAFVEAALDSVLAQTAASEIDEIVVVDAGSAPETLAVVASLPARDPRVRLVQLDPGGVSRSRNAGAAATSAELIAFLDGDDLWTAERLARQLAVLRAQPEVGLVYSGYVAMAEDGSGTRAVGVYDLAAHPDQVTRYFLHDPPVLPSSMLIRRSAFEAIGGFDETCLVFEDTDFCLRLARATRMKGLAEPLIRKRYRTGSLSAPSPGLMAHHAYVAFRAGAMEPRLMPLAPRRLAERAGRLALVAYYAGDLDWAATYARTALRLRWRTPQALAVGLLCAAGPMARRLAAPLIGSRARLHGR